MVNFQQQLVIKISFWTSVDDGQWRMNKNCYFIKIMFGTHGEKYSPEFNIRKNNMIKHVVMLLNLFAISPNMCWESAINTTCSFSFTSTLNIVYTHTHTHGLHTGKLMSAAYLWVTDKPFTLFLIAFTYFRLLTKKKYHLYVWDLAAACCTIIDIFM